MMGKQSSRQTKEHQPWEKWNHAEEPLKSLKSAKKMHLGVNELITLQHCLCLCVYDENLSKCAVARKENASHNWIEFSSNCVN